MGKNIISHKKEKQIQTHAEGIGDIQDLGLGTIVGVKTYGKGTVQGVYPVDGSDAVKLTVAKYKTAKGREIDGVGVVPDVEVKLRDGDTRDYQFDKAVELLVQ